MAGNIICKNPSCGKEIQVAIFKGSDFCSVNCQKQINGEALVKEK